MVVSGTPNISWYHQSFLKGPELLLMLLVISGPLWTPALSQSSAESCNNAPDTGTGVCRRIRDCPPVLTMLQKRPLSQGNIQALQRAQCGFDGTQPKVCCPSSGGGSQRPPYNPGSVNVVSTGRPPQTGGTTTAAVGESAMNHPRLRILPFDICGAASADRIINGNRSGLMSEPWMARIGYNGRFGHSYRCGGSLITKRYVLTAAHCVTRLPAGTTLSSVLLGENDANTERDCEIRQGVQVCAPPTQSFTIESVLAHPEYSSRTVLNDVALIRLNRDADLSDEGVRPICLPVQDLQYRNIDNEKKLTVSGWGTTETGTTSPYLLYAEIPPVPVSKCKAIYDRVAVIAESHICAGGDAKDSCGGDSGGPLTMVSAVEGTDGDTRKVQVGIVSFGPTRCGSKGMPGVYTRVGSYLKWILNNIN